MTRNHDTAYRHSLLAGALALSLLLTGCSLAPIHQRPEAPIPTQWQGQETVARLPSSAATLGWQSFITDEKLRQLVELSLANNRDLRQTLFNVEVARAMYRVQRADRLPGIDALAGGNRQRLPADLSGTGQAATQSDYQAGVGLAAFELDLFGRVRNLSESALAEFLATEEAAKAARISLAGEVVQAYLARDGAQRQQQLAARTLESREASLRLTAARRTAGTASALDYQDALGLAQQARAELERAERAWRQANNALLLLSGVTDIAPYLPKQPGTAPVLVQDIAPGAPSDLLAQRPDIQAAEHRLRARHADIGAARAAFFPRISLTGFLGSSSAELSDLFRSGQRAWSFAPQISLPIFDGGRNRANLNLASVRRDIAVAAYEQSIQTAFREVADALAATDTLRREEAARKALTDTSQQTLRLAEARYRAGVDDHLRYLDAQRNAFANESAYIDVVTQRQIALAGLFRVLGGGWHQNQVESQAKSQTKGSS